MIDAHIIDSGTLTLDPARGALDQNGKLRVLPASYWGQFSQNEIAAFCVKHGFYCIPTTELIEWLKDRIAGRSAIEIGAGCGVLAAALNVPATDNRMQERPEIRAIYAGMHQAPVRYGEHVKGMDAREAISHYKPEVVLAAWVTHKWDEREAWREGNAWGVDETRIVRAKEYIHIGNRYVHRHKPILDLPHEELEFPWLISRAINGSPNFISIWSGK